MKTIKKDNETGEIIRYDSETGEEEYIITSEPVKEKPKVFKIPNSYYMNRTKPNRDERKRIDCSPTAATAVLFLLPTTILFYPFLGMIVVISEVMIHIWAHRKNKLLKNKNLYYQSPLHIICQEFCGACKEENSKMKISKLYERRADKIKKYGLEYVRRVVT